MAMNPQALRNLTLASAKHLVNQGHITPAKHASIVRKVKGPKAPMNAAPTPMMADEAPVGAFGSLNPRLAAGAGHYMGDIPE